MHFCTKKSDDRVEVGRSVRRSSKRISEAIGGVTRLKISADSSRKPLTSSLALSTSESIV